MANTISKKQRKDAEELVYEVMGKLDKSGENEKYYRELLSGMSDAQFLAFMKKELPFRFQHKPSVTEPTQADVISALKVMGVPLIEKIYEPFLYRNKDGKPVATKECLVGYIPLEKVQQFVTKKNKYSSEIGNRDMKSGRLVGGDKGATMSDREFETLATAGLTATMKEFAGPRADAMESKNIMYNIIGTTGTVKLSDLPSDPNDSLSRNMLNAYLTAACIDTDLLDVGDYTRHTLKDKRSKGVSRT